MKWRLMIAFGGLIAIVLIAQDVPLASYLRRVESERLLADLQSNAFLLAGASEDVLSGETAGADIDLKATLIAYAADEGGYVVVVDTNGTIASRIGVVFNGTQQNFRADLVRVSPDADLALLAAGRVVGESMTGDRQRRLVEELLSSSAIGDSRN